MLAAAIAQIIYSATRDMHLDGGLTQEDVDLGLGHAGQQQVGRPFARGDATSDGIVDGADFLIWNANKFSSGWLFPLQTLTTTDPAFERADPSKATPTTAASPSLRAVALARWTHTSDDTLHGEQPSTAASHDAHGTPALEKWSPDED